MNIESAEDHILKKLLFLGLIGSLIPFYCLALFNYPAGFDDFQNAVKTFEYGEWGYVKYIYFNWAGRFSSNALLAILNPLKFEEWLIGFKLLPIITFTSFIFSAAYLIRSLSRGVLSNGQIILGSIGLLVLYLFAIPSVAELFYWFTGACVYTAGIIFFMILAGSVVNFATTTQRISKGFYVIVILLTLIATIGINEPVLLAVLFLSFGAVVAAFLLRSSNRSSFFILFILACIIALFSIAAPGNAVRGSMLHGSESMYSLPKLVSSMAKSLYFSGIKFISWANSLVLLLVSILIIPAAIKVLDKNLWIKKVTAIHPLISLSLTIVFLAIQVFTAFLGTGDAEPRIWSSVYFFFLLAWVFNLLVFVTFFRYKLERLSFKQLQYLHPVLLLLLFFSADGSINQAMMDLAVKAPKYSKQLEMRYALIESSANKLLIVPPLFDRKYKYPKTIFVKEVGTDPVDRNNISLSKYFNLRSIKLAKQPSD